MKCAPVVEELEAVYGISRRPKVLRRAPRGSVTQMDTLRLDEECVAVLYFVRKSSAPIEAVVVFKRNGRRVGAEVFKGLGTRAPRGGLYRSGDGFSVEFSAEDDMGFRQTTFLEGDVPPTCTRFDQRKRADRTGVPLELVIFGDLLDPGLPPAAPTTASESFGYLISVEADGRVYSQAIDSNLNPSGDQDPLFRHKGRLLAVEGTGMAGVSADAAQSNAVLVWVKRQGREGSTRRQIRAHFLHLDPLP